MGRPAGCVVYRARRGARCAARARSAVIALAIVPLGRVRTRARDLSTRKAGSCFLYLMLSPLLCLASHLQELEKFKFVLDFKIKELKKQIEPREVEIGKMRQVGGREGARVGRGRGLGFGARVGAARGWEGFEPPETPLAWHFVLGYRIVSTLPPNPCPSSPTPAPTHSRTAPAPAQIVSAMDSELERYHKSNAGLDLAIQVRRCDSKPSTGQLFPCTARPKPARLPGLVPGVPTEFPFVLAARACPFIPAAQSLKLKESGLQSEVLQQRSTKSEVAARYDKVRGCAATHLPTHT